METKTPGGPEAVFSKSQKINKRKKKSKYLVIMSLSYTTYVMVFLDLL